MRKGISIIVSCLLAGALLFLASGGSRAAPTDPRDPAIEAAERWLARVDARQYGESWEQAASYFKKNVGKDQWAAMAAGVRDPLGKVRSRVLRSVQRRTSLPGAPDGEYVVMEFDTSFEKKKAAVETITPMREDDGSWRVSGYYIK